MTEKLISIIVPAYNIADYIERCIKSILNSTHKNIEVIIVNDGSSDNTAEIAEKLSKQDNRVSVINKKNDGVSSARIAGAASAHGDYIGFVDGDDTIDPDMYERLFKNSFTHNADISHCGYKMVFPSKTDYYYNTGKLKIQNNEDGLKDLLTGDFIEPGLVNKLFKRELIKKFLSYVKFDTSIKINEDLLMNYYLFKYADISVYEDFCPYNYILRNNSAATSKININKLTDPLKVLKIIQDDQAGNEHIQPILKKRQALILINLATMKNKNNEKLIKPIKKQARTELKNMLGYIKTSSYFSKKLKIMAVFAASSPNAYAIVHSIYSMITGSNKKYEVK